MLQCSLIEAAGFRQRIAASFSSSSSTSQQVLCSAPLLFRLLDFGRGFPHPFRPLPVRFCTGKLSLLSNSLLSNTFQFSTFKKWKVHLFSALSTFQTSKTVPSLRHSLPRLASGRFHLLCLSSRRTPPPPQHISNGSCPEMKCSKKKKKKTYDH